jgi:putative DNA primase/helicase
MTDALDLATVLKQILPGSYRIPCPTCDRGSHDRAFSIRRDERGSVWHCFRCGMSGASNPQPLRIWANPASRGISVAPRHATPKDPSAALAFFRASKPITANDVAGCYLLARGCVIPPRGTDLQWHPDVRHPTGHVGPALVAKVTDAITGEFLSVHRTWIDPNRPGHKADVSPPRAYWRALSVRGGVVRLWPDDAVTMGLGVAEGIETALCLAHGFTPVWAALDAGHLSAFPALEGIESLAIAADHDPAGIKAARDCANRWSTAGREVCVIASPTEGHDIADEVTQ